MIFVKENELHVVKRNIKKRVNDSSIDACGRFSLHFKSIISTYHHSTMTDLFALGTTNKK